MPIRPERMCAELTRHVPDDAIVVVDTGHAGMWMGGMYDLRSPRQSYLRSAGHLGWAFPAGLGAKCGAPDRPVVTFTGDAGLWYHIGEIETAVRWKINAVTVVNNNASGNQSKRGFDRAYGGQQTEQARELWTFNRVNFARIAEEMGALGLSRRAARRVRARARARACSRAAGRDRRRDRHRRDRADGGRVGSIGVDLPQEHRPMTKAKVTDLRKAYPDLEPDKDYPPLKFKSLKGKVSAAEWEARVDCACAYRLVRIFNMDDIVYNHISARIPGTEHSC